MSMKTSKSYGHRISRVRDSTELFWISWQVDHKTSRRWVAPVSRSQTTDLAGAKRFTKKWSLELPAMPEKAE